MTKLQQKKKRKGCSKEKRGVRVGIGKEEKEKRKKINGGLRSTYLKLLCSDYHLMEAWLWGFYGG